MVKIQGPGGWGEVVRGRRISEELRKCFSGGRVWTRRGVKLAVAKSTRDKHEFGGKVDSARLVEVAVKNFGKLSRRAD